MMYKRLSFKNEILRKTIHLFALIFPITYFYISTNIFVFFIITATIIMTLIECLRYF